MSVSAVCRCTGIASVHSRPNTLQKKLSNQLVPMSKNKDTQPHSRTAGHPTSNEQPSGTGNPHSRNPLGSVQPTQNRMPDCTHGAQRQAAAEAVRSRGSTGFLTPSAGFSHGEARHGSGHSSAGIGGGIDTFSSKTTASPPAARMFPTRYVGDRCAIDSAIGHPPLGVQ